MKINIVLLFFAMAINNGIEKPDYKVVKKYNNFELRDYGSIVIATTSLERNYSRSNSVGFQKVASYIFGGNDKNMKIAMTAPVMTSFHSSKNKEQEISFVMPKKHNLDTLPDPTRDDVIIKEKELGLVAAISFGGWATEERAKKYIKKLELLIKKENLIKFNEIIVAQYNAPWAIPPFRKNEILIPIKNRHVKNKCYMNVILNKQKVR